MSSSYIKIYNKKFNILDTSILIKIKIYKTNYNQLGIIAFSKKINFTYSFIINELDINHIHEEIKKQFKKILAEKNKNEIVVFEMPNGELFISY